MEQLIQTLVERLIEATVRSVKAEDAIDSYLKQIDEAQAQLQETKEALQKLQDNYDTTQGAYQYRGKVITEQKAQIDALTKEVNQLKAKLNALEGVEEADRGVL